MTRIQLKQFCKSEYNICLDDHVKIKNTHITKINNSAGKTGIVIDICESIMNTIIAEVKLDKDNKIGKFCVDDLERIKDKNMCLKISEINITDDEIEIVRLHYERDGKILQDKIKYIVDKDTKININDKEKLKKMFKETFKIVDDLTDSKMFSSSFNENQTIKELESLYTDIKNILE